MKYKSCLFILILFVSCIEKKPNFNKNKFVNNNLDLMLKRHSLERKMFNDSMFDYDYVLWTNYHRINLNNPYMSTHVLYYPSVDSVYTLITNYNKKSGEVILDAKTVSFMFLDNDSKNLYPGFGIIDNLQQISFDFCWGNNEIFYLLQEENKIFLLSKITIKNDTIWIYRIDKTVSYD